MFSRILRSSSSIVHRRALFHTTPGTFTVTTAASRPKPSTDTNHTPDSYSKDVDVSPPPDPTIHRVDAASEAVQKPHEPPSSEYSRAGTKTRDYEKQGSSSTSGGNKA